MINVLLVEDELLIRSGMRALINWEENGFKLEAEASNGEEALELLKVKKIDIVITDIRMPVMDGLKLIEEIREQNLPCEIIVLSSYDEFQYVKSAMKYGVKAYIHKPTMVGQELMEALAKVKEDLTKARFSDEYQKIITEASLETQKNVIERTIKNLLQQGELTPEAAAILRQVDILEQNLYPVVVKFIPESEVFYEEFPSYTQENIVNYIVNNIRFEYYNKRKEEHNSSQYESKAEIEDNRVYSLKEGDYLIILSDTEITPAIMEYLTKTIKERFRRDMIGQINSKPCQVKELCTVYRRLCGELEEKLKDWKDVNKLHPSILEAVGYIKANYMNNVTLEEVGQHIHVSPAYLSRLFLKEIGETFVDFLTKLRIEKAKGLLSGTKFTVYEIAEKVGYQNSKYFMKIFKKVTGITPGEYREGAK